jgi:hypothetical protein
MPIVNFELGFEGICLPNKYKNLSIDLYDKNYKEKLQINKK